MYECITNLPTVVKNERNWLIRKNGEKTSKRLEITSSKAVKKLFLSGGDKTLKK